MVNLSKIGSSWKRENGSPGSVYKKTEVKYFAKMYWKTPVMVVFRRKPVATGLFQQALSDYIESTVEIIYDTTFP